MCIATIFVHVSNEFNKAVLDSGQQVILCLILLESQLSSAVNCTKCAVVVRNLFFLGKYFWWLIEVEFWPNRIAVSSLELPNTSDNPLWSLMMFDVFCRHCCCYYYSIRVSCFYLQTPKHFIVFRYAVLALNVDVMNMKYVGYWIAFFCLHLFFCHFCCSFTVSKFLR